VQATSPAPSKLQLYFRLVRLDKPIGTVLLLWPTLSALWLASNGVPDWKLLLIFCLGTFLMRSAGCAVNDYADQDFDRHVKRTAERPITSGRVSGKEALAIAAVLSIIAFLLIQPLNTLVKQLSVAALALAASYPYFKRFFALPQAYLGIAFGFGIPMGFAAVYGVVPPVAWLLLLGNIFWTLAYDTEYAMVDRDDDLRLGLKTSAITFGRYDVAIIMLCYALHLMVWLTVGLHFHLGIWFLLGLAVAAGCAIYHYFLIRSRERAPCFAAFRHNNYLGAAVFAGIALDYALR